MDGYLFDTNAVSILWNVRHPEHDTVKSFFASVSGSPVWLSTIVLAEIEYGLKVTPKIDVDSQNQVRREMSKCPLILDIDKHTIGPYSDLRAELFKYYSPKKRRGRLRVKWPEDLVERTSAGLWKFLILSVIPCKLLNGNRKGQIYNNFEYVSRLLKKFHRVI